MVDLPDAMPPVSAIKGITRACQGTCTNPKKGLSLP